jgi:hypothetical protein
MAGTKSTLLYLREELIDRTVEHEFSNGLKWYQILWPQFGRVEDVEFEFMFVLFLNNLDGKCPLGKGA